MCRVTPCRKGSVFDDLMVTWMAVGAWRLSTFTSAMLRLERGSKESSVGHVISPDRRNPQKHRQQVAQSIFALRPLASACHTLFIASSMAGVMGKRRLELTGVAFFTPLSTYSTRGMEWILRLSHPRRICSYLMAARYDFIVPWASFASWRWAMNKSSPSSVAG